MPGLLWYFRYPPCTIAWCASFSTGRVTRSCYRLHRWYQPPLVALPSLQLKAKKQGQPNFVCGWISKGSPSALTMKTALAYNVDEGEFLVIQTLHGPVTLQGKEYGNTWVF